jgi:hypothetical protein
MVFRNVGLFIVQPTEAADSSVKFYWIIVFSSNIRWNKKRKERRTLLAK